MSRVFRSLTRGSVDRTLLSKPKIINPSNFYGKYLAQGYSASGIYFICNDLDLKIINSHHKYDRSNSKPISIEPYKNTVSLNVTILRLG